MKERRVVEIGRGKSAIHIFWKIVFMIIIAFQLAILSLILLTKAGIDFTFLRISIGVVYLTFIPGFLLLCSISELNKLDILSILLFSIGLSLFVLIFIGILLNLLFPLFNVQNPISDIYLLSGISLVVIFLTAYNYRKFKSNNKNLLLNLTLKDVIKLKNDLNLYLFLIFLTILSILAGLYIRTFQNSLILLFLL